MISEPQTKYTSYPYYQKCLWGILQSSKKKERKENSSSQTDEFTYSFKKLLTGNNCIMNIELSCVNTLEKGVETLFERAKSSEIGLLCLTSCFHG